MKAIYFSEHGGAEVLQYGELPTPEAKPGEVLVRLEAAALNHVDLLVRKGIPGLEPPLPHILGSDGAGVVASLGEGVESWETGQRVVINGNICLEEDEFTRAGQENLCDSWELLGETIHGTYAQYVSVPAGNLVEIPNGFSAKAAAASALVYLTAWHSLVVRGNLQAGESVLVVGSSGGVNSASIQVAKHIGAKVIAVGSNPEKLAFAESLGADELIDRSKEDWSKAAYKLTEKRGVDAVVDNVGSTFPLSMRAVRKGGRILNVGRTGGSQVEIDVRYIFGKQISIIGSTMGTRKDFAKVMKLVFDGSLETIMDKSFPLENAMEAHERLEAGKQLGKITLDIS
jgi:NADPH:quinone reductase-like Zn-dependent oxidoreductase